MVSPGAAARARMVLLLMPLLVHLPALCGAYRFDPIYLVSGLTEGTWHSNGLLPGYPWYDANAGVTTQALGALAARDWLHLRLPWWNPYSGIGLPLVAEGQTPAFFLPFVLLLAMPHGLLALRMMLMALAGLFSFALLRRLRLDVLPALVGALLFELNGTFAWFAHGPALPIAFLPLVLLGLEQARDGAFPLATVLGVAWSFLAGFPETAALNMLLAGVWGAWRCTQSPAKTAYAVRAAGAAVAGLLVAAPAIWPFLDALPLEFLGQHDAAGASGLVRANLGLLLFPAIFGNPHAAAAAPQAVLAAWARAGGYVFVAEVAVALAALRRCVPDAGLRWSLAGFVAITGARAALLPPAMALFASFPLLRQAMIHMYVLPAWSLIAALLAAYALQDWRYARPRAPLMAALLTALVAAVAVAWVWPDITALRQAGLPYYHPGWAIAAAACVAAPLLALLAGQASPRRQILAGGLLIAPAATLFLLPGFSGTHGRTLDSLAIRYLQAHLGLGRVVSFGPLTPNYGAMFGVAELGDNALPVPANWERAIRDGLQPNGDGINFAEGALPSAARLRDILPRYEALGATYALTWPGDDLAQRVPGPAQAYAGTAMRIWALRNAAPYAEAPGCALQANDRLGFTATCAAPSRLLRRELSWPGWQATVNGAPASVDEQGLFQTVALPQGASTVQFWYTPPHGALAWCACAAGVLLAASGYWLAPRARLAEDRVRGHATWVGQDGRSGHEG